MNFFECGIYRITHNRPPSRLYQGKQYHVIASQDGTYEFDGRPYESLSKIAYEITGTLSVVS